MGLPSFLWTWHFLIPEVGKTFLHLVKFWLYQAFSRVDSLACQEKDNLHKFVWDGSFQNAWLYNPDPVLVTRGIFWPQLFTRFPHASPKYKVFKTQMCTVSLLYQILLYQAFSHVDFLALIELGDLHQCVQDWALKKAFLYNPDWVDFIQSNMGFFNPRGWWNFTWICQVLAVLGLLLCWLSSYAC